MGMRNFSATLLCNGVCRWRLDHRLLRPEEVKQLQCSLLISNGPLVTPRLLPKAAAVASGKGITTSQIQFALVCIGVIRTLETLL
jgi:hypothetical protein